MLATLGIPDILGCVNGHFVALELKKDAKEVRKKRGRIKLQRHVLRAIKKAGGYAAVVCPETADDILAELLDIAEDFRSEIFHTEESHHYLYPEEESEGDSN